MSTNAETPVGADSCKRNPYGLPDFFTEQEWLVLFAITSAVLAPVDVPETSSTRTPGELGILSFSATIDCKAFRTYIVYVIRDMLPPASRKGMKFVLGLLAKEGFFPSYVLWSKSGPTPFHKKPLEERIELIQSWAGTDDWVFFPPLRTFTRAIVRLTCQAWFRSQSKLLDENPEDPESVLYRGIGFEKRNRVPKVNIRNVDREGTDGMGDGLYPFEFLDLTIERLETDIQELNAELRKLNIGDGVEENSDAQSGIGPKHIIKHERSGDKEITFIETDVVIVGSGCGGAVVAKRVAEAYGRCIVVEKGNWYSNEQFPLSEAEASQKIYEGKGLFMIPDKEAMSIIAGSTWGGGGTVNWSVCLPTHGIVREEWATKHGLNFFMGPEYQKKLDVVFDRLGAHRHQKHNHRNNTLLEGSRKLGYYAASLHQNNGGTDHIDAYCACGCAGHTEHPEDEDGWGWKLGVAQTYLPDAARAGAEFIKGMYIEKIIIEDGVAKGVKGVWTAPPGGDGKPKEPLNVVIRAKKVVVSAGSLHSPALLLRSEIPNSNIGHNLTLHPTCMVMGVYPEETKPLSGAATTAVVTQFENLDGEGYGFKIETTSMVPCFSLATTPWTSPTEYKRRILLFKHMDGYIPIVRDKVPGRVYINSLGQPKVDYVVSEIDRKHLVEGICASAKIAYTQGATEILTNNPAISPFKRDPNGDPSILDPSFQAWLDKIRANGLKPPTAVFASAHQMGSCRMGIDPATSVVDAAGKVWGVQNLYVADGSVLPTAPGVNPMCTIMATVEIIAEKLVAEEARNWKSREERWLNERKVTVALAKSKMATGI
ncbi:hypothetical protein BDZ91DRAFT_683136 [Kalaharituber pfeilii]|nr:hypothetical protein BDZ91DRAFT_683136 [Kalaharituber pfeilii]